MAPSIEIALPFHGSLGLLQEAVDSVRAQSDPEWRLRVRDDNPEPSSQAEEWLRDLRDERVTYASNGGNLGVSATFNRCLADVRAEHVVFLGSDDRLGRGYVARARAVLSQVLPERPALYQPQVTVIDAEGRACRPLVDRTKALLRPRARAPRLLSGEPLARSLMHGTWTYFPSLLWRTDAIASRGFDETLRVVQDVDLLMDLVLAGEGLCLDPVTTFEYRRHAAAASSAALGTGVRLAEERAFYDAQASRLRARGWSGAARAARLRATSRLHGAVLAAGDVRRGDVGRGLSVVREHVAGR